MLALPAGCLFDVEDPDHWPYPDLDSTLEMDLTQVVAMGFGVKEWAFTCSSVNTTPVSGTFVNAIIENGPSGEPPLVEEYESEYDPRRYRDPRHEGIDWPQHLYSKFVCKELIGVNTPEGENHQIVLQIPQLIATYGLSRFNALRPIEKTFVERMAGPLLYSQTRGPLGTIPPQPLSVLNGTYENWGSPMISWVYPKFNVTLKAYDWEFTFPVGEGEPFSSYGLNAMWIPNYPGEGEAQFDNALAPVTFLVEATEYWPYGGKWNPTTGL